MSLNAVFPPRERSKGGWAGLALCREERRRVQLVADDGILLFECGEAGGRTAAVHGAVCR